MEIKINPVVDKEITKSTITQEIESFGRLGREIKISPKANCVVNKAGFKAEYFVDTVSLDIGIGNNHTAFLVMTKEAWKTLQDEDEKINIMTTEQFKKELYK